MPVSLGTVQALIKKAVFEATASTITIGSTVIPPGGSTNALAGLTSVTSQTFVGSLGGNADTATTATDLQGGLVGQLLYQTAANATSYVPANPLAAVKLLSQSGNGTTPTAPAWLATTGTGSAVLAQGPTLADATLSNPTLTSPSLGVATATSLNKVTITQPATAATLALANGSTLATVGAFSVTFTAQGPTSLTLPTTGTLATVAQIPVVSASTPLMDAATASLGNEGKWADGLHVHPSDTNKAQLDTGLLSGGVLSANADPSKFDVTQALLYFADYTVPGTPTGEFVTFGPASAVAVTNIGTQLVTYVGVDAAGVVHQQADPFTNSQRRTIVSLGAVVHSNNTSINAVNTLAATNLNSTAQVHDLMSAVGALCLNGGNTYSASSTNLKISKTQGDVFKMGSNFQADPTNPHVVTLPNQVNVVFRYRLQNSTEYPNTSDIDPNHYDVNGVLTLVPTGYYTVQRVSLFQSNLTRIQYGQYAYGSITEALAGFNGEPFVQEQNIRENSIVRCYLVVRQGCTDLSLPANAVFIAVSKFGVANSYLLPRLHINVNDADYTLTGIRDALISVESITGIRTMRLPPATVANQTVVILDESGAVSPTSYIHVLASGTDQIKATENYYNITGPYNALMVESNGQGRWDVVSENALLSAGIQLIPNYTDNNDGTVTVGTGFYNLYRSASGLGSISAFSIPGGTFTPVDGVTNYLVADYGSGTPVVRLTQDVTIINETTIIPVLTIYRNGSSLHILEWDSLGLALVNKLHQSIVKTQRYRRESGLGLGEATGRVVTISGGTVWVGAVKTVIANFNSSVNSMYLNYHVGGAWTTSLVTQYNNSQYDNGTDLVSINPNKYTVNYVYVGIESRAEAYVVLGTAEYGSLSAAQASQPGPVPPLISSHAILVGRIIALQGAATAAQIDSAFVVPFTNTLGGNHNDLGGLQGGQGGEFFHLTSAQYNSASKLASVYTVATLPSPVGSMGVRTFVSDALAPTFGATVVTGGSVPTPVYSDGAAWKVG